MTAPTVKTTVQYRVMSKAPGEDRWKWRRFTGAGPHGSFDHAVNALRWQRDDAHAGWEFRIERRVVETATYPWHQLPRAARPKVAP